MFKTVLPSSLLGFAEPSYYDAFTNTFNNVSLKIGVVKTIIRKGTKDKDEPEYVEYDVLTFQQDQDKGIVPITYKGCVTMDSFGGVGDFFEFIKSAPTGEKGNVNVDDGSYVLLLCIDGTSTRGVIIGALPHHGRKSTLASAKDKHLEGEYNGLRMKINDDGELTLTFKGKTDNKGKPKTSVGGSQIKMEKDGSVEINDKSLEPALKAGNNKDATISGSSNSSEEYEKIRIDKTKNSIDIISRKDQNQTAGGNYNLTVKGNSTHKAKSLVMEAQGKASLSAMVGMDIKTDGAFSLNAMTMKIKSTTTFQLQSQSVQIQGQKVSVGNAPTPAIVNTTQFIGIGNLGAPVVSTAMGPFSSTVSISI